MKCGNCEKELSANGKRWLIVHEVQTCHWGNGLPEVEIHHAQVLSNYCTEEHALAALDTYLVQVGAVAKWSDVRPIEECARCGRDIDTKRAHSVITVSVETDSETDPEILDCKYPARFCDTCVPTLTELCEGASHHD